MPSLWTQSFPPPPLLTETNLPSQEGKTILITGAASGLGFHLASIFYSANATVYVAGRSEPDGVAAIARIKNSTSSVPSRGRLEFLKIDLSNLTSVRHAVEVFRNRESRLDILYNNAGIGSGAGGTKSAQGTEIQFATNCVGPLLFTRLLLPCLRAAATTRSPGAVRVVWAASMVVDLSIPTGGIDVSKLDNPPQENYEATKLGNWYLASELACVEESPEIPRNERVLHLAVNPGSLRTRIWRHFPWVLTKLLEWTMLHDAKFGAYTNLWAGVSLDIGESDGGRYVIPWGRWHPQPRADLILALKSREEGGVGQAKEFVQWCESKAKL